MAKPNRAAMIKDEAKKSILLLPAVILLVCFFIVPIILTIYYSFTNMALTGANAQNFQFVGIDNYVKIFKDQNTLIAIKNTLIFLIGSLVGQSVLGFVIAYLMKGKAKAFRSVVGPCILVGWVMPEIVVSLAMLAFFDMSGTMNAILTAIHLPAVEWIYAHPMATVVIANVWHGTAFSMMNFQSALDNVSGDIEEAARVDGAGEWEIVRNIILPNLRFHITFIALWETLGLLTNYVTIMLITNGGPGVQTEVWALSAYHKAFSDSQYGYGAAISLVLIVVVMVLMLVIGAVMHHQEKSRS